MPKVHLAESREALTERTDIQSKCGVTVKNAIFAFRALPGEFSLDSLSTIAICRHCVSKLHDALPVHDFPSTKSNSYLYGIQPGEEAKQEEAAA
jgi:hypothetical protein